MKTSAEPVILLGKPPRLSEAQEPVKLGRPATGKVAEVVAVIAGLADGNCASSSDVGLVEGYAESRAVDLNMTLTFSWSSDVEPSAGRQAVPNSRLCSGSADVQQYLAQVCGPACRDPAMSRQVAEAIAKSAVTAFEQYPDDYRIGMLPHAAHVIETCQNCGGDRQVRCGGINCVNGHVPCQACGVTGQATCSGCTGSGYVSVSGNYSTCGRCGGSGRHGNCHMCLGSCYVACSICRGRAFVACAACGSTGYITHSYHTYATGKVSRSIVHPAGAPGGFRRACQAVSPVTSLASSHGKLVRTALEPGVGKVQLTLHCEVEHVHADLACGPERISVDALGPSLHIPLMPPFLDGLTAELADDIQTAAQSRPAEALKLASNARLTREILATIGQGLKSAPAAVNRRWSGAVSEGHAELLGSSLHLAYSKAARSPIRRTWLKMSPVIVAGAVLANIYQAPLMLLRSIIAHATTPSALFQIAVITVAEAIVVLPVVLLTWALAARAGRRQLRAGVGSLARRGPSQGRWPVLGMLLALVAGWGTAATRLDAAPMGLPWAPPARPGGRSIGQEIDVLVGQPASEPAQLPTSAIRPLGTPSVPTGVRARHP